MVNYFVNVVVFAHLLLHAVEEGRGQVGIEEVGASQQVVRLVQRPRRQLQRHAPSAP